MKPLLFLRPVLWPLLSSAAQLNFLIILAEGAGQGRRPEEACWKLMADTTMLKIILHRILKL